MRPIGSHMATTNTKGPEPNSGCWLWTGMLKDSGYGKIQTGTFANPNMQRAHRVAYELFVGPIPPGLQLDHLCRVSSCVNPNHLEPVTNAENTRRGIAGQWQKNKTHCPQGHEYTIENTMMYLGKWRRCRTCSRERNHLAA